MTRRTVGLVATPIFILIVAAGGYVAGRTRSAEASEVMQGGRPKICWHDQTSVWRCGSDSSGSSAFAPALAAANIQEISVTVRPKAGPAFTFYVPATTDAIFFARPPIENMLIRYYEATRQRARANALRAELRTWGP